MAFRFAKCAVAAAVLIGAPPCYGAAFNFAQGCYVATGTSLDVVVGWAPKVVVINNGDVANTLPAGVLSTTSMQSLGSGLTCTLGGSGTGATSCATTDGITSLGADRFTVAADPSPTVWGPSAVNDTTSSSAMAYCWWAVGGTDVETGIWTGTNAAANVATTTGAGGSDYALGMVGYVTCRPGSACGTGETSSATDALWTTPATIAGGCTNQTFGDVASGVAGVCAFLAKPGDAVNGFSLASGTGNLSGIKYPWWGIRLGARGLVGATYAGNAISTDATPRTVAMSVTPVLVQFNSGKSLVSTVQDTTYCRSGTSACGSDTGKFFFTGDDVARQEAVSYLSSAAVIVRNEQTGGATKLNVSGSTYRYFALGAVVSGGQNAIDLF